jgi:hypothetical protein
MKSIVRRLPYVGQVFLERDEAPWRYRLAEENMKKSAHVRQFRET